MKVIRERSTIEKKGTEEIKKISSDNATIYQNGKKIKGFKQVPLKSIAELKDKLIDKSLKGNNQKIIDETAKVDAAIKKGIDRAIKEKIEAKEKKEKPISANGKIVEMLLTRAFTDQEIIAEVKTLFPEKEEKIIQSYISKKRTDMNKGFGGYKKRLDIAKDSPLVRLMRDSNNVLKPYEHTRKRSPKIVKEKVNALFA